MNTARALKEYILSSPIVNTHSHVKNRTAQGEKYNLDTILKNSYVNWCHVSFDETRASRQQYLDKVRFKHYFKELEAALCALYNLPARITADNWDTYNRVIEEQNETAPLFDLLREKCRYQHVLLDAFWGPGDDHQRPDLFAPSFRVNAFLHGFDFDWIDSDGMTARIHFESQPKDIDAYVDAMRNIVTARIQGGCVSLKSAVAYDRGLDFFKTTKDKAQIALTCRKSDRTQEDILHFQSYIYYALCDLAAELEVPFQNHTGLGQLKRTNAMQLAAAIDDHPDTKFVLFHGSYPWTQDIGALLHYYPNVYPDLCWLPMISPTAAEIALAEALEVGTADKLCWGCDAFTFEESYAARETMAEVLSQVLAAKVDKGYYDREEAETIIRNILWNNPQTLYRLEGRA